VSTPRDAVEAAADPVAPDEQIHHGNQFTKILRHGAWYFAASVLTKAAGIVLVPIYTQYLSPSEYGVLGTLDAIARLLPLLMSFYLDAAFIRYYYEERAISRERVKTLYSTQFWFVAVWGSIVVVLGMLAAPVTIEPLADVPFAPYVPLVLVGPLFLQLGIMGSQLMRAELRAREVSVIGVASFAATAAVSLVLLIRSTRASSRCCGASRSGRSWASPPTRSWRCARATSAGPSSGRRSGAACASRSL
jgi:O-antigen/teichoic acid export membrane protein